MCCPNLRIVNTLRDLPIVVMYDIKEMKHSVWVICRERQQKELTYEKAVAISDSYNDDNVKQSMCSN